MPSPHFSLKPYRKASPPTSHGSADVVGMYELVSTVPKKIVESVMNFSPCAPVT